MERVATTTQTAPAPSASDLPGFGPVYRGASAPLLSTWEALSLAEANHQTARRAWREADEALGALTRTLTSEEKAAARAAVPVPEIIRTKPSASLVRHVLHWDDGTQDSLEIIPTKSRSGFEILTDDGIKRRYGGDPEKLAKAERARKRYTAACLRAERAAEHLEGYSDALAKADALGADMDQTRRRLELAERAFWRYRPADDADALAWSALALELMGAEVTHKGKVARTDNIDTGDPEQAGQLDRVLTRLLKLATAQREPPGHRPATARSRAATALPAAKFQKALDGFHEARRYANEAEIPDDELSAATERMDEAFLALVSSPPTTDAERAALRKAVFDWCDRDDPGLMEQALNAFTVGDLDPPYAPDWGAIVATVADSWPDAPPEIEQLAAEGTRAGLPARPALEMLAAMFEDRLAPTFDPEAAIAMLREAGVEVWEHGWSFPSGLSPTAEAALASLTKAEQQRVIEFRACQIGAERTAQAAEAAGSASPIPGGEIDEDTIAAAPDYDRGPEALRLARAL